uniref:Uncharacterized protein n=1 Tax=Sphaerodactylus townsendi TaxID=933632 RepID=A0ACB8F9C6_9SAUR
MFPAFNFLEWLEGALQEEREAASATSPVCCTLPSPGSSTWLDGSPVSPEPQPPTPNEAPPAEESGAPASGSGKGGEASSGTREGPVERLQPLATESNWTGVNEWREQESTSAPSGDSFPPPPVKTGPRQQPKKKAGASFSSEQQKTLENIFQKQYYVTVTEVRQLAILLDLSITQYQRWQLSHWFKRTGFEDFRWPFLNTLVVLLHLLEGGANWRLCFWVWTSKG